ncbi:protein timeless homolog [Lingula anatina]|uniref:Protein timeless homolog n=1 Tax=Lingula anatina TaxID=7574 RepID=A0A1S3INP7_LINAN|nr:protein timeless homolog [Lingula anatina]|eukprot:XP_013399698.1 protein timeless homolog [Lingula anatina]
MILNATSSRTDDDASIHDQLLWSLHVSGMEDLLLYVASSDDERQFSMHVLEIISLMFREQTPEQLASAGSAKTDSERQKEDKELDLIREKEKAQKLACVMKYSSRHSRFGGTYVMKNVKSISENQMIYHRSLAEVKNLSFDQDKKPKKKPKNRQPIKSQELTRRSTLSIRLFLKEFCIQLLENCYNPLMYAVKDSLLHSKAQENDESYYLWAMRFFMQFNRLYKFRVELVSETMSVPTFHYIQTNLMTYHETVLSDKKEAVTWSKRMHLALRAYQELLMSLNTMDKDPELKASAKVLKVQRGGAFDKFQTFLKDLIETTHCFTKMLEHFCKKNKLLVVQKKKKGGKKKKSKASKQKQPQGPEEPQFTQEQLENQWDGISGGLSAIFQDRGHVPENVTPFDAASEETDDQQRINAMVKIHEFLRGGKAGEAVAMFRAAREVWPDRQEFGTPDISPEDEFMALREIFFTDIPKPAAAEATQEEELQEEDDQEEIEEEEGVSAFENYEQEFSFREFIDRFGNPQVLKHYSLLLSEYSKNSTFTNHCIVKLLHRVAVDTGKVGMLFQASLFRTFQKILFDPMAKSKHYEEIVTFSKYVVRKFFECAQKNEKIFVELLFWKTNKDAMEVVEGYGTYKEKHSKSAPAWTEEQDEELKYLFDKFRDDTEKDVVDLIMENITDTTKTRRQVLRELCHLELINSAKDLKKPSSRGAARIWREEQEYELRELFDRFKGSEDPVGNILNNMEVKRSKAKVIEKLLSMGLVEDRKELYKKRKRKSKKGRAEDEDDRFIEEDDVVVQRASSDEEEEEEEEPVLSSSSSDSEASADADEEAEDDKDDDGDGGDDNHDKMLHKMVKKLFKKGLAAPVKWVQQRLRSVAEDREKENEYEPIPLVPLSEENEDAMDNSLFRCFLKKAGILPPSNEQERFWRIPANESPANLRSTANKLDETYKPPKKEKILSPSAGLSKEKSARFEMLKNMAKNKIRDVKAKEKGERIKRRTEQTHPSPSTPGTTPTGSSKQKSSRLKLISDESSDDDNDDDLTPVSTHQTPLKDDTPSKSGHRLLDSDSSDDDDQPLAQAGQLKSSKDKLTASEVSHLVNSDSSDDEPVTGKRKSTNNGKQDIESDTDDDEPLAASMQKAKKASLASDSDSDEPLSKPSGPKSKLSEETRAQLKRALESDSSDDSDDDRLVIDSEKEKTKQPSKRTKIQEESDLEKKEDKENMRDTSAKELASFPATLLSQGPESDSDSDIEDHIPLRRGAKRKTIESDSDDD